MTWTTCLRSASPRAVCPRNCLLTTKLQGSCQSVPPLSPVATDCLGPPVVIPKNPGRTVCTSRFHRRLSAHWPCRGCIGGTYPRKIPQRRTFARIPFLISFLLSLLSCFSRFRSYSLLFPSEKETSIQCFDFGAA